MVFFLFFCLFSFVTCAYRRSLFLAQESLTKFILFVLPYTMSARSTAFIKRQ